MLLTLLLIFRAPHSFTALAVVLYDLEMLTSVLFTALTGLTPLVAALNVDISARADPCAAIGGKKWVAPQDVRACFASFKVDEAAKKNVRNSFGWS